MDRLLFALPNEVLNLEFSRDGSMLLVAEPSGAVQIRDTQHGRRVHSWRMTTSALLSARLHPSGHLVAVSRPYGSIELLRGGNAALRGMIDTQLTGVSCVSFAESAGLLGVVGENAGSGHVIQLWDVTAAQLQRTLTLPGYVTEGCVAHPRAGRGIPGSCLAALSPDGSKVGLALRSPPLLSLIDLRTGALLAKAPLRASGSVKSIRYSPTGKFILIDVDEGGYTRVTLWDLETGDLKSGPNIGSGPTDHQFLDQDGTVVTAAAYEEMVFFWDVKTSEQLRQVEAKVVRAAAASRASCWPERTAFALWLLLWFLAGLRRYRQHLDKPTGRWDPGVFLLPLVASVSVGKVEFIGFVVDSSGNLLSHGLPGALEVTIAASFFTLILGAGLFSFAQLLLGFTRRYRGRVIYTVPSVGIATWTIFAAFPLDASLWSLFIAYLR
jgi:hypothetical protein